MFTLNRICINAVSQINCQGRIWCLQIRSEFASKCSTSKSHLLSNGSFALHFLSSSFLARTYLLINAFNDFSFATSNMTYYYIYSYKTLHWDYPLFFSSQTCQLAYTIYSLSVIIVIVFVIVSRWIAQPHEPQLHWHKSRFASRINKAYTKVNLYINVEIELRLCKFFDG